MLDFAENQFGPATLTKLDGGATDMTSAFDFSQSPCPPLILTERNCNLSRDANTTYGAYSGDHSK